MQPGKQKNILGSSYTHYLRTYTRVSNHSERILESRSSTIPPALHVYETPLGTVQRVLQHSPELSELKIIREWLQDVLPVRHAVEVRKGYMPFTKNALRAEKRAQVSGMASTRLGREKLVQHLDPDAASRGPGTWDVEDLHYEKALVRSLFEYVRAGELDMALDLCAQTSQSWRAASLRGAIFYHDPSISEPSEGVDGPLGNRSRSAWRRIARKAALNVSLDRYERAMYGALCGDLSSVLAVSESWEERLWSYVNARFEQQLEQLAIQNAPNGNVQRIEESTAEATESLESIFEQLAHASPHASTEALDPYHVVQRAVITNSVPDLLARVNERLPEMQLLEDKVYARLIRFFAHLALFCHLIHIPLPVSLRAPILNAYVNVLQNAGEGCELVALYSSSLEPDNAHQVYAEFLCAMDPDTSLEDRRHALLQVQPHGMDPAVVASKTVDLLLAELVPAIVDEAEIREWNANLSMDERRLILSIDWLTFFDATFPHAILQTNTMMRVFMSTGRLHAAHSLLKHLPSELLGVLSDVSVAPDQLIELDHWRSYFDVLNKNVAVRGLWSDAALANSHTDYHNWVEALAQASESTRLACLELLELGWLQFDMEDDSLRREHLMFIRRKYIPEIVTSLHLMLVDTSQVLAENLTHALALPNLVADERLCLYLEFSELASGSPEPLKKYLSHVREAALVALDRRQDVLGCNKTPSV